MEKKLLLLVVVLAAVVLYALPAFALDPMGPPTAGLQQGEWRIGGEYMFSNMDIEADGIPALDFVSDTVEDVQVNKGFANIGAGASENLEVFLRLGGAGAKPDEDDNWDNLAGYLGSGSGFSIGGGLKLTLFGDETVKWGALAQLSWADLDFGKETYTDGEDVVSLSTDVSLIEAQFAFGPTIRIGECMSIYGGPFLHILEGDADITASGDIVGTVSSDLEEDSMWGGYIGTLIDILPQEGEVSNGAYLFGEVLFTGDAWGAGVGLGWRF